MLNRSRSQRCPACRQLASWDTLPAPRPDDVLYCHFCHIPISTYDHYIKSMIHQEVRRLMARFGEPGMPPSMNGESRQQRQTDGWVRPALPSTAHWPSCPR